MIGDSGQQYGKAKLSEIKDPHVKRLHKSGLMEIKHKDPREIILSNCPDQLVELHMRLRSIFAEYMGNLIDEVAKRDGVEEKARTWISRR